MKIGIRAAQLPSVITEIKLDGRTLSVAGTSDPVQYIALTAGYSVDGDQLSGPPGKVTIRAKSRGVLLTSHLEVK